MRLLDAKELLKLVKLPVMTMGQGIKRILRDTQQLERFRGYLYR